jgi:hypothetical protein
MAIDSRTLFNVARQLPLLKPLKRLLPNKSKIPERGTDISLLSYSAKVRYKMAYDRRPLLSQWADKVAVREYVAKQAAPEYLNELYFSTTNVKDIRWADLPREFAFKPSHGSGAGIFVHERADVKNELPVRNHALVWEDKFHIHPDRVDVEALIEVGSRWLKMRYENYHPCYEWAYEHIEAQQMVEKYIADLDGNPPTNYWIYTFHGAPAYITIANVFNGFRAMVTPGWEYMEVESNVRRYAPRENLPPKPDNLVEMLELAKTLSGGIDYVRVDLYNNDHKITFGEMTNYPAGGRGGFYKKKCDRRFSGYWRSFDGY